MTRIRLLFDTFEIENGSQEICKEAAKAHCASASTQSNEPHPPPQSSSAAHTTYALFIRACLCAILSAGKSPVERSFSSSSCSVHIARKWRRQANAHERPQRQRQEAEAALQDKRRCDPRHAQAARGGRLQALRECLLSVSMRMIHGMTDEICVCLCMYCWRQEVEADGNCLFR